ncbi:hypothetical protein SRABI128_01612 [Microbacterium sp. Bi128]|nr:hypothetical protein SRABI128_01612 [Microbacterium sp. Bi128]
MRARAEPTATVSSSWTRISCSVPATGEGISVSTLSVEISSSGSSTATSSPTALSQRVIVPSVTLSPSSGSFTSVESSEPDDAGAGCSAGAASAGADSAAGWAGVCSSAAGASSAGAASGASSDDELPEPSPIFARIAPTSTVSSSWTRISSITPETGEGISVSTLSVEISNRPSSSWTVSPTCLSQRVTVPSVTLSPRAGRTTEVLMDMSPSYRMRCLA